MLLLTLFAFLGGVVTILSPCILPVLPVILAGSVDSGKKKPFGVVAGFVASFTFFTLFLTLIVNKTNISADSIRDLAILILIIFGLSMIFPKIKYIFEKYFSVFSKIAPKSKNFGFWGGFLIGISLGLVWTPCVGPILASVISLALVGSVTTAAFAVTVAYSLGTGLPMLLIIYGGRGVINKVPWLLKNGQNLQKIFGVLMILTAISISFNLDRKFQTFVLDVLPNYGSGLTSIEDNKLIQENLTKTFNNMNPDDSTSTLAPEIIPTGEWFNSEPLKISELRGKVVLLDFITYTCINCIRTYPYLREWHNKYRDEGLVIIGIHTPEFEFEKNPENVKKALEENGLEFPVVQDNEYKTWNAYNNRYWPRKFLIDHNGYVVYDHIGEGSYEETEEAIRQALKKIEKDLPESSELKDKTKKFGLRSPETYFGALRNHNFGSTAPGQAGEFDLPEPEEVEDSKLYLSGEWVIDSEYAENGEGAKIIYKYQGQNVFIVATAEEEISAKILIDGEEKSDILGSDVVDGAVTIFEDRLYTLIEGDKNEIHTLEIIPQAPGVRFFAFTFG